jgi:cyclopropane fatty-acyl-phospholipid synthase-like methyltransferase
MSFSSEPGAAADSARSAMLERMDGDEANRWRQRELVRSGYDAISLYYRDDQGRANPSSPECTHNYRAWLEELALLLPPQAGVLDLGCGAGVPASRLMVNQGCRVTGLDVSAVQIERARSLVPEATFVHADMATWDCQPASFEAIVTLYALIHLPLPDQQHLIPRLKRWLTPAGYMLAIVGHEHWTGVEDYFGTPMFWDHADIATYLDWLKQAGFSPLWHRFIPEGAGGHTLVLCRTNSQGEPVTPTS